MARWTFLSLDKFLKKLNCQKFPKLKRKSCEEKKKKKNASNQHFSPFPQYFLPFQAQKKTTTFFRPHSFCFRFGTDFSLSFGKDLRYRDESSYSVNHHGACLWDAVIIMQSWFRSDLENYVGTNCVNYLYDKYCAVWSVQRSIYVLMYSCRKRPYSRAWFKVPTTNAVYDWMLHW